MWKGLNINFDRYYYFELNNFAYFCCPIKTLMFRLFPLLYGAEERYSNFYMENKIKLFRYLKKAKINKKISDTEFLASRYHQGEVVVVAVVYLYILYSMHSDNDQP